MIKVSKLTDYAVVILSVMSKDKQMSTSELASATHLPEPTVAKILRLLGKAALLNSTRGATGGYTLAKDWKSITIADIVCAIDGPISLTACADGKDNDCNLSAMCGMNGRWNNVNTAIIGALENVSLADMAG